MKADARYRHFDAAGWLPIVRPSHDTRPNRLEIDPTIGSPFSNPNARQPRSFWPLTRNTAVRPDS